MEHMTLKQVIFIALAGALGACGGGGGGGSESGNPAPVNKAPTISGAPSDSTNVGESYSFTPTASDPDGDTLTFSITNAPIWASFDSATGELSGSPTSSHIGAVDDVQISVSDGQLSASLNPFAIAVMPEILGRNNFTPKGDVFPTADGYQSVGGLELTTGNMVQDFANSDLTVTFDSFGNLIGLNGDTDVPTQMSITHETEGNIRSVVDVLTGAEINADPDFGIKLIEDRNYFVYYIGVDFDMTITDRRDPQKQETITITTPYGGQSLLISDPTDSFLYRYNSTPFVGASGEGESDNGLIPFVPELDFAQLDSFTGHTIETGTKGLGIKFVDVLEISGSRVIKDPQFSDINWDDLFASTVEYKAGMNGDLNFALSIAGFGLFSFDLAEVSATVDVGLDRQHMAMSLRIAPDDALFPGAYGFSPSAEVTGSSYLNGDGDYGFFLDGVWKNQLPAADIGGMLSIENGVVGLQGSVSEGNDTLAVGLTFSNDETVGRVEFPDSFAAGINDSVSDSLDRKIAEVEQLLADLDQAKTDYDFEVSLRGLRSALPGIADEAIRTLNKIPGNARNEAKADTLDYLQNKCVGSGIARVCLDDIVDADDIADDAGAQAHRDALAAITAPKAAMTELKRRAQESDDETLRDALRQALADAYDHRRVRIQVSVRKSFGTPFNTTYTIYRRDNYETVLSTTDANNIATARDNVYRIQETSDIVISTQQIIDQLPTTDVITTVKAEVDQGTASVPSVEGLGYRAAGNSYDAFVTIDGTDVATAINVLKPSDVRDGVSDLLADQLLNAVNN